MKYYLIETDSELTCADVIDEFTNKKKAIIALHEKQRQVKATNNLRKLEGSKERNTNKYLITNTDDFIESTGYKKCRKKPQLHNKEVIKCLQQNLTQQTTNT